jgi:hypothetical protein
MRAFAVHLQHGRHGQTGVAGGFVPCGDECEVALVVLLQRVSADDPFVELDPVSIGPHGAILPAAKGG